MFCENSLILDAWQYSEYDSLKFNRIRMKIKLNTKWGILRKFLRWSPRPAPSASFCFKRKLLLGLKLNENLRFLWLFSQIVGGSYSQVFNKIGVLKNFRKIHRKTIVPEFLCKYSFEFWEIFKNRFVTDMLRTTSSDITWCFKNWIHTVE